MSREIKIHYLQDWSQLPSDKIWDHLLLSSSCVNFGIHKYNDRLWTSGYVGICHFFDRNRNYLIENGKRHVGIVSSKFKLDPWKMLETVMQDDEYDDYLAELDHNEYIYKIFYDQELIRMSASEQHGSEILYALSFINVCYSLCKKGLKKSLYHEENNFNSKIRRKIDIKNNIVKNTLKGRNDRFFCRYIDFRSDTLENRILKTTLVKCIDILNKKIKLSSNIYQKISFCKNILNKVSTCEIKSADFNKVSVSGMFIYYRPLLNMAKFMFQNKFFSYLNCSDVLKHIYIVPYVINMEKLFEFYVRSLIKKEIMNSKYNIEKYSKSIFIEHGVARIEDAEQGAHLIKYCIPDIIICDSNKKPILVLDAKYKPHSRSQRSDTFQLLSYVFLTGAQICGFIFPKTEFMIKEFTKDIYLKIGNGNVKYFEILLSHKGITMDLIKFLDTYINEAPIFSQESFRQS